MPTSLRILVVEDQADDHRLLLHELRRAGYDPVGDRVENPEDFLQRLDSSIDMIFSDYRLPAWSGLDALNLLKEYHPEIPFIIISGTIGEDLAVAAMRAGATDYLLKDRLSRLGPAVAHALERRRLRATKARAEEAAQRLAAIVRASQDAIIGMTLDGTITDWNPGAERLYGWLSAEAIGRSIAILVPPDQPDEIADFLQQVRQGIGIDYFETVRIHRDGRRFEVAASRAPFTDPSGKVIGVSSTSRDISERKRLDREIRVSEARFRRLFESDMLAIGTYTADGWITDANDAMLKLIGYSREEVRANRVLWKDLTPPEYAPLDANALAEIRAHRTCKAYEKEYIRKDGSRIPILIASSAFENGHADSGVFFVLDLTERKRIEKEQALLAAVVDSSEDAILSRDVQGRVMTWNSAAERLFGYTADEAIGQLDSFIIPSSIAAETRNRDDRIWNGEHFAAHESVRMHKSGKIIPVSVTVSAVRVNGKIVSVSAIYRDIGEKKRAEDALRLFRALIDKTSDGIEVIDPATGRFLDVNERTCLSHGYSRDEFLKMSVGNIDPHIATQLWSEVAADGFFTRPQLFEATHRRKDGTIFPVEVSHDTITLDRDYIVAVVRDITERKRAEDSLRASEERFRAIMENTPAAADIKDEDGRFLYVNAAWLRQFDPAPDDWLGKTNYDYWPRQTADLFRASDVQCLARNAGLQTEETARTADGRQLTKLVMKFPLHERGQRRICGMSWDITEWKRAESDLRMRDRAIKAATQGLMIADGNQPDWPIIYASPACETITGYHYTEVLGRNVRFLQGKDTDPAAVAQLREAIRAGKPCTVELLNYRKDGTAFWNELSISPVRDDAGLLTHFIGVQADVTARRSLQNQFQQAQKMEAIGQLAGGVAHDFNNLLTIINGYSEILLSTLPGEDSSREMILEILKAGERSAGLTRQLLVFSRQQVLMPKVFDLNDTVRETEKMFRRVIGEDIELHTISHPRLDPIRADQGQIEQVLMNLVVNARDAMPQGGKLTIETRNVELTAGDAKTHPGVPPGNYVMLAVTDTGSGMTEAVRRRLFEPFFTTKEVGKGTGLCLAVVHGIIQQSDGHIQIESEVGVGTSFKIYLPQVKKSELPSGSRLDRRPAPRGTETILLVEDEDALRALTLATLRRLGYIVLEAATGKDALAVAEKFAEPIHLLLTDVVMPVMGGRRLAEELRIAQPDLKVLYISGYTDDAVIRHGILHDQVNFLQKPFSPSGLAFKVREVLDGNRESGHD